MKKVVKSFGKGGMHIYLTKKDGFKVGDEIDLPQNTHKVDSDKQIREIVREEIDNYMSEKRGY